MELRQSDLNFVCSRIPQDVRRFMVEGRGLMLAEDSRGAVGPGEEMRKCH